jgi:anthranilate synthase component 1
LLESVVGGERFGRYSFIGLPARTLLRAMGFGLDQRTEVVTDGVVVETSTRNPLDFITDYQKRFKVALRPGLPRFCGGLAGYFGYDTVRYIEKKLVASCPPDTLGCPDILLLQCEELAVIDNLSGKLYLIVYADPVRPEAYSNAKKRLRELKEQLKYSVSAPVVKPTPSYPAEREFAKADYLVAVLRAKELIAGGDFMQVQVGQRIKKRYTESPLSLYRALRALNPSPYMYYYHFGDFHVVGASPEILVRQEQVLADGKTEQKITIRPLAGTRPRGASPELDKAAEVELINDPKERAEHVMLIDLARNDIGRIAKTGSVKVTEAFNVERYSHVMHIVSNVEGTLVAGPGGDPLSSMDVLRATFPAGTLTGAPKVHAMELIDQLEPTKRGLYGGACGYLSYAGDMDVAIAIRTGIIKDQVLYVQAAAGVVADSVPELEWRETEAKARALLRASELVEEGLE